MKAHKGIKVKKKKVEIKEKDINQVLSYLQERAAQFTPVESRDSKIGDYLICDYSYAVEDKVLEEKKQSWLWVDKEMFLPGLSDQLKGIKLGATKEFDIKLPEKFKPEECAKKTAKFSITLHEIKEKKLSELNDEFAKTIGKQTLEELKKHVSDDIQKEKEMKSKQDIKAQIIDSLVASMPIDVPAGMVTKREELLKSNAGQKLKQQRMSDDQIAVEVEKLKDQIAKEALKQIRMFFIFEAISKEEKIAVTDEELDVRVGEIALSYNQKKEDVMKYFKEKEMLESIYAEIWEEKIVVFITDNASIQEVEDK